MEEREEVAELNSLYERDTVLDETMLARTEGTHREESMTASTSKRAGSHEEESAALGTTDTETYRHRPHLGDPIQTQVPPGD